MKFVNKGDKRVEIVKREFIYREKTNLEPAAFKTYINKYIKELRSREDVYKVSGTVTGDFSKCTVRYTQILPDPTPSEENVENLAVIVSSTVEEVQKQLG